MFVEDVSAYLSTDDFAQVVQINGAAVPAIFDNAYAQAAVGPYSMAGTSPALTLQTSAVPATPEGLSVSVAGVAYVIAMHQPDGTGMSVLLLEKA